MPFLIQTTMAERRKALRTSMVKVAAFAAAFAPKSVGKVEQLHGFVREMGGFVPMLHAHFHGEIMNHGMERGSRNIPWMVAKSCTS
jgi:hypothetical protein